MKRLSQKQRHRHIRRAAYRLHNLTKKRTPSRRRHNVEGIPLRIIDAPKCFSLDFEYIEPLLQFIKKMERAAAANYACRIRINFHRTEKMVSDGTLYFLAHVDHLIHKHPDKIFCLRPSNNPIVNQVLQQVGISNLLNSNLHSNESNFHKTVKYWRYATGCNVNAQKAEGIFKSFQGKITNELRRSIYDGIAEAMTNCCHHAYQNTDQPPSMQKWWLFSREDEHEMHVTFCDLGIGIPKSLYRDSKDVSNGWWENLHNWLKKMQENGKNINDALKIKAAIEIGQTRTNLKNRGKGLKQMVNALDDISDSKAEVVILSGKGRYQRVSKNSNNPEFVLPLSKNKKTAIKGTLIYWNIPLIKKEADNERQNHDC